MTPAVPFLLMPNRHFLVKFWKCQKALSILPHEAKALLELFCLQPIVFGWRQNSSSSSFEWFEWFYIGGSGLDLTDDFQKFCGSGLDRIQFYQIRTGLGLKNFTVCLSLPHTLIIRFNKSLHNRLRYYEKYDKQLYLDIIKKTVQNFQVCNSKPKLNIVVGDDSSEFRKVLYVNFA